MVYLYAQFVEDEPGFSYQPRIWHTVFHRGFYYDPRFHVLQRMVKLCWLSEYKTSLNLGLDLEPEMMNEKLLRKIQHAFIGGDLKRPTVSVGIFDPLPHITPWAEEILRTDIPEMPSFSALRRLDLSAAA